MQLKSTGNLMLRIIIGLLAVLLLSGCSEPPRERYTDKVTLVYPSEDVTAADWPDEIILEQFAGYWYYRFAGGVDQTWQWEAPHFRMMASREQYENYALGAAGQNLSSIEVKRIEQVGERLYRIRIGVNFRRAGRDLRVVLRDHWVLLDEQWYHVIRDPLAFPFSATFAEMQ